jgi:hypothetical protein
VTAAGASAAGRTGLCLWCRTVLSDGEPCDGGDEHVVVSLVDPTGREAALTATWGDRDTRDALARALRTRDHGKAAAAVGGVLGAAATFLLPGVSLDGPLFGALVGGGLGFAINLGGTRRVLYPAGGARVHAPPAVPHGRRGEVVGHCELTAPASGTDCVAWAIELRADTRHGQLVMLRDAETAGFELHLQGGGVVRIPAGRLRLLGAIQQQIDVDDPALADHLASIVPGHQPNTVNDPFYANVVYEQIVLPGDHLELASVFEPTPNPKADPALYRESPATVLTPRGVPMLRVLAGAR